MNMPTQAYQLNFYVQPLGRINAQACPSTDEAADKTVIKPWQD